MMKQSTFIFISIACSIGRAQSVRPKGKLLVFCIASEMLSDAVMFRGDMTYEPRSRIRSHKSCMLEVNPAM